MLAPKGLFARLKRAPGCICGSRPGHTCHPVCLHPSTRCAGACPAHCIIFSRPQMPYAQQFSWQGSISYALKHISNSTCSTLRKRLESASPSSSRICLMSSNSEVKLAAPALLQSSMTDSTWLDVCKMEQFCRGQCF